MTTSAPQFVSRTDADTSLADLERFGSKECEGFFGPESMLWRVNREAGVFLGAGRAALLQLAHPWVAAAIDRHSNLKNDAIGRFHGTFRVIYTIAFGTRAQALAASRRLFHRHTTIRGELPRPVGDHPALEHYEANELGALLWVFATLADTAVLAYDTVLPPLSPTEKELYYTEFRRMGLLFGLSEPAMPSTWLAFQEYMHTMLHSDALVVDDQGRALGQNVLAGVGTWVRPPRWYRAITTRWLPPHLRRGFGLAYGVAEQRAAARARLWLPRLYPWLPKPVRYVGPFHEAESRLRSEAPGRWTRWSNRFWMGQETLSPASSPQHTPRA